VTAIATIVATVASSSPNMHDVGVVGAKDCRNPFAGGRKA
jgi:hypothetical protein